MEQLMSQWAHALGSAGGTVRVAVVLPRLVAALGIGVLLGVRPWRLLTRRALPRPEMMQAQILLCSAAAVVTIVIGDSLAKAFGLVGLGSFVRFRSGLKDPRDAAILFLVIGLGMACGHGTIAMAVQAALFVALLMAVLDLFNVPDWTPDEKAAPAAGAAPADGSAPAPATAAGALGAAGAGVGATAAAGSGGGGVVAADGTAVAASPGRPVEAVS